MSEHEKALRDEVASVYRRLSEASQQCDELAEVLQRAVNDKLGDNWKSAARIALTTLTNLRGNSASQNQKEK